MTDKKQVKGLLDYISLKPGEEADFATNSGDYVFGMGIGATDEVRDLAIIGRIYINIQKLKNLNKNDNNNQTSVTDTKKISGRPKKQKALGMHQVRALILWDIAQTYSEDIRQDLTNTYMIELAEKSDALVGESEGIWESRKKESLQQSVSRGKTWWEIDHKWHSDKCYEFLYGSYTEKKS